MAASYKGTVVPATPTTRTTRYISGGFVEEEYTYTGKYSDLHAAKPTLGSTVSSYVSHDGKTLRVREVVLARAANGNVGTMTVKVSTSTADLVGEDEEIREVEFQRVDQDIRFHPIYQSGGSKVLTESERDAVEAYMADTDATTKSEKYTALNANQKHLALRLMRGQTSYAVYIPVARKTTVTYTSPFVGGVGDRENPPGVIGAPTASGNSKSYTYIKTADRKTYQAGKWTRTEEWTGFEQVDNDIIDNI